MIPRISETPTTFEGEFMSDTAPGPQRICFISDLHLQSRRSAAHRYLDQLHVAAKRSQHFVLGGDIFDFKWSTLQSLDASIDNAEEWLTSLAAINPNCRFHFLLGNHDYHPALIQRLPALASRLPNFAWEHYFLRMGDIVFLHGDVADRSCSTQASLEARRTGFRHEGRSKLHHGAYDLIVRSHLHRIIPTAVYPRKTVARRILAYLRDIQHGPESGVKRVYFGHTHRIMLGYEHAGLTFFNGGAPIGRANFHLLEMDS
jgi:UDP-2,3-diacylglucosamine pyrophosphatase LpxH